MSLFIKFKKLAAFPSFKNSFWNVVDTVIQPVLMIAVTPLFLYSLGVENYGIWLLVTSVTSGLGALNFGMSESVIKFVSENNLESSKTELNRLLKTIFTLQHFLALFILLFSVLLGHLFVKYRILGFEKFEQGELMLFLGAAVFIIKLYEQIVLSVFKGFERYDLSAKLSMVSKILLVSIQIISVFLFKDLFILFIVTLATASLFLVVEFFWLNRFYPVGFLSRTEIKMDSVKEVFGFSMWSWGQSVSGIISSQLDKYIVAGLSNVTVFAYYSIALMVAQQIHGIIASSASWVFPYVSRKIKIQEEIGSTYYLMQSVVVGIGFTGLFIFFLFRNEVISLWLSPKDFSGSIQFITQFIGYTFLSITSIVPFYYLNGSGFVRFNTISGLSGSLVTVLSMGLFFKYFSVGGLVFGRYVTPLLIGTLSRTLLHRIVLKEVGWFSGIRLILPALSALFVVLVLNIYLQILFFLLTLLFYYLFYFRPSTSFQFDLKSL